MFRFVVLVVACAALSVAAFAQSTVTGSIAGTVVDPSKAVVVGAKVTIRNIETNVQTSATADAQGKFRVLQLQPGTYAVTADAANFAPAKAQAVIVELGRVTELDLVLNIAGKMETVEVAAEVPMVNTLQQDFSSNINQEQINQLPINGRRWSNYALLTPGATGDGNFGLISFRGISGLMNNSTVDGGDNNQAFFSEERGRTRASYVISQNSVREFQVNTANYSAEYGRAAGAVVNTVTKSGTNRLHGQGFYFIRDNELGATNPFTTQPVKQADGSYLPTKVKPDDRRQQFGGNLGGPVIKDKLFFFFNYDGQRWNAPAISIPTNPSAILNALTASEITTLAGKGFTAAQGQSAIDFLAATMGEQLRTAPQDIFFPKLDWRISQNNTFTASYNRMRRNALAGVQQSGATVNRAVGDYGNDLVKVDILNARLSSAINNTTSNEVRFSWGRDFEFQTSQPRNPVEDALLSKTATPGYGGYLPETYIASAYNFGRPYYLERFAYPDEHRMQGAETITHAMGKHLIKAGVDITRTNDLMNSMYRGGGAYSYTGSTARVNWITDYLNAVNGTPSRNYSSFNQGLGQFAFEFNTMDYSFFVQDDIRVLPRLTINLGLRYEYESLPNPQAPNYGQLVGTKTYPGVPGTQTLPRDLNNVGPRIGFAYDVFGDGKTSVRGGYGIYYGRIINSTISSALTATGAVDKTGKPLGQAGLYFGKSDSGAPTYPNVLVSAASTTQDIAFFAPKAQAPQIHQADLVVEREIAKNTVARVSYLLSVGHELMNFIDTNLAPSTNSITYTFSGGPYDGRTLTVPVFTTPRPNTAYGRMTVMTSNINSTYNALVVAVDRRMSKGLQFTASYTWAHALDQGQNSTTFNDGNDAYDPFSMALEYGNSNFDIRQRIVGNAVWEPQFFRNSSKVVKAALDGWALSPIVTFSSGRPYTEYISGSPYFTGSTRSASSSFNGSGGTNRLAPWLGRNSFRYPWLENIDLRLSRKFRVKESHTVEFLAEAFNLFNHQIISGINNTMYTLSGNASNTATYQTTFGAFTGASGNLYRERQIQIGARYSF